jgi:hypothetical protein
LTTTQNGGITKCLGGFMEVLDAAQDLAKKHVLDVENIKYDASREVLKIINGHKFTDTDYLEIGKSVINDISHDVIAKNCSLGI